MYVLIHSRGTLTELYAEAWSGPCDVQREGGVAAGDKLPVGVLRKPMGLPPLLPAVVDRPRMARRLVSVAATMASSALLQSLLSTGYCAMKTQGLCRESKSGGCYVKGARAA